MSEAFSIGRLAAVTGLPVKAIRFSSDAGLPPPSGRTEAGHRRDTATDVARLQLVRALRDLGVALARLEAAERGRLLDRCWDRVTWSRAVGRGVAAAEPRAAGVEPADPRAAAAVAPVGRGFARLVGRRDGPAFRRWLVSQLDAHGDPRAERYRELVGIVQGRPSEDFAARVADHAWVMAALRHHRDRPGVAT